MPKLIIVFDPSDKICGLPQDLRDQMGVKEAILSLPEGIEGKDIYAVARRLAELLLEQL